MGLFRQNLDSRTDEELMSLLTLGEQPAFDELYKRYSKPLLNFFYRLMDYNREKAEDLLHDLFLKIIEKNELFDGNKPFRAWVYTLAANMVKNEYRRKIVRQEYVEKLTENANETVNDQTELLDRQLFKQQLNQELEKMDSDARLIIHLRFDEELSVKQIAETMNVPEGTIKSRLHYLTRQLSEKLSAYAYQ